MGILSAIGSFFSSIGSAICSVVSSIGSALSSFASGVGMVLATVIEKFQPIAEAIGKVANALLSGLGILRPNETIEEIGERALQARDQGITIDKFPNFDEYMKALRDFDLDEDLKRTRNPTERLVAGLGLGSLAIEKKFDLPEGSMGALWLLPAANPEYFTADRLGEWIQNGRLAVNIYDYLERKLSGEESSRFERALSVDMTDAQKSALYDALDSAQRKVQEWAREQGNQTP
jgi:hypothetical protein